MIRVTTDAGVDIYINSKKIISFGYDQRDKQTWVIMEFDIHYRLTTPVDQILSLILKQPT